MKISLKKTKSKFILTDILDDYKKDAQLIRWISATSRIKPKLWTFLTVCFPLFIRDFPR